MPNTVTITGFKEFEAKLKKMPDIMRSEVSGEVRAAAEEWAKLAKDSAPVNYGFLKGGIKTKHGGEKDMFSEVTSLENYSAYMEWGTKSKVSVPADLAAYALQFKGGGKGFSKELIYEWARKKGIPQKFWWPIFISIVRKGVKPHPFFFIQKPIIEKLLFSSVKKIVETEH